MRKREPLFLTFFLFLFLSFVIFFLSKRGLTSGVEEILQKFSMPFGEIFNSSKKEPLKDKTADLIKQLVDQKNLENENKALRDQFATALPSSLALMPANVVGSPGFIPGVSLPQYLILDKGAKDGVMAGFAVIYKDNLVGKIVKISNAFAKAELVTDPKETFTGKTLQRGALGVIMGSDGAEATFNNVLLSEKLEMGDIVVTKGDINEKGVGFPPDLIVGEIVAVDKKVSSLFQSATIKSRLDFTALSTIFIVTGYK